jgi:hypothetical protein
MKKKNQIRVGGDQLAVDSFSSFLLMKKMEVLAVLSLCEEKKK